MPSFTAAWMPGVARPDTQFRPPNSTLTDQGGALRLGSADARIVSDVGAAAGRFSWRVLRCHRRAVRPVADGPHR
jgi:hypothetical protein